ncbi:hypothetical protein RKD37_006536 [Streptomyces ambofaciens]
MPSDSNGAGIAYRAMSSPPCWNRSAKRWKACGPGTSPANACSRAKTRVSSSSVTRACTATVSGRANGTRRATAPTPDCTASRTAACRIHVAGSTNGNNAQDAAKVAAQAHTANRARPLIASPFRRPAW